MRRFRRVVRVATIALALLIALVAVALVAIQLPWTKDRVRRLVVSQANQSLNGELSIGRLGGSLYHDVVLDDVRLVQAGVPVLQAQRVRVTYDPFGFLHGSIAFGEVALSDISVRVVEDASGWNVARLLRPASQGEPARPFAIDRLEVTRGRVTVDARGEANDHDVRAVELEGALSKAGGPLEVTVDRLTAVDTTSGFRLERLSGRFDGDLQHVTADFTATAGDERVAGHVTGHPAGTGSEVTGDVDLARLDLSRVLGDATWASNITGHVTARAALPGGAAPATLQFAFAGPQATAFGYEGRNLDVRGTLTFDDRLRFVARGDAYGAAMTVNGEWRRSGGPDGPAGFTGSGTFRHADLANLPDRLHVPSLDSDASGRYTVHASTAGWDASVSLDRSRVEGAVLAAGTTGRLESREGILQFASTGRVDNLDVPRLAAPLHLPALDTDRLAGRVNGDFRLTGSSGADSTTDVDAHATIQDSGLAGGHIGRMEASVRLDGRSLVIDADGDFTNLTSAAAGLPPPTSISLDGRARVHVAWPDYRAPVSPTAFDVDADLQLTRSTIDGVPVDSAVIAGSLKDGIVTVRQLSADAAGVQATASGTVAIGASGESNLTIHAETTGLEALGRQLGHALSGAMTLDGTVSGPADAPVADATVSGHSIAYGDTATALTLDGRFHAAMPDREVDRLDATATVSTTFAKVRGFDVIQGQVTAGYRKDSLSLQTHFAERQRTLDVTGLLDLRPEGRTATLQALTLTSGATSWSLPKGSEARIHLQSDRLRIEQLVVGHGDERVSVEGALLLHPTSASGATPTLTLRADAVQLEDVNHLLLGTRSLTGQVDGRATVTGALADPTVAAVLTVASGSVEGVPFDAVHADVQYERHLASIDATLDESAAGQLTVKGTVPVGTSADASTPREMQLRVSSTPIALGFLQAFTSEIDHVAGTGRFDLDIAGTLQAPVLDGSITLQDGAFSLTATGVRYRALDANLRFERNHLQLAGFHMTDADGHPLEVTGGLDLLSGTASEALNVLVHTDDFHVLDNALGSVQVTANLDVKGTLAAPRVTGDVHVNRGRIEVDAVLERTRSDPYSTRAEPPVAPTSEASTIAVPADGPTAQAATSTTPFGAAQVDVSITIPDTLVLRGRDLRVSAAPVGLGDINVFAGGTLHVRRGPDAPLTVVGNAEIVRGYYSFQGRRFDVRRDSNVRFRGLEPIDPALDVTGDRRVSGVTASVHVRGSARSPEIALSSEPTLDEADILSLILFGRPVNTLGASEQTSLSQVAAGMAASAIATPITDSVARALNLDLFEVQTSGTGGAPVVSIGTSIGSRLYVAVRQETGHGERRVVSLEYRIASFLRLVTTAAQSALQNEALDHTDSSSGIDLLFFFQY